MPEIAWLSRWKNKRTEKEETPEIANMDELDYVVLLKEIERR